MVWGFKEFCSLVQDQKVDWEALQGTLRIRGGKYPENRDIILYYDEKFNGKTSNLGRSKWHFMDKLLCIWVVAQYCKLKGKNMLSLEKSDFKTFSAILRVSSELLEFKWLKLIKPYLKNKPWCVEEDQLITKLMDSQHNKKWTEIALKLSEAPASTGLRTAKQVRERWINYIDPTIRRADWTNEEDAQLLSMIQQKGKRWSVLGKHFKRTQNNIKNRYNSMTVKTKEIPSGSSLSKNSSSLEEGPKIQFQKEQLRPFFYPLTPFQSQTCRNVASFRSQRLKMCGYRLLQSKEMA